MKVGYVSIVGKPNAGKSTLLNTIIGEKLAIVTPKAQTTRKKMIGIFTDDDSQIIFIDTPGYTEPKDKLNEKLLDNAKSAIKEVDLNLVIVDASRYMRVLSEDVVYEISQQKKPAILLINKIDKIKKSYLLPIIDFYRNLYPFDEIIPISSKYKDGINTVLDKIKNHLPEGEVIYDMDMISSQPERVFVEEFIREGIFQNLNKEIPYSTYVKIVEYQENEDSVDLMAEIFVEKDSQKKILIGKSGSMIRNIREYSVAQIETFLRKQARLKLWVKVDKNWRKDEVEQKI